ncbi:MAG: hypothetical protein ACYTFI_09780 [Planctomycetota bacterium]|jgi:hypothetical protein
MKHALGLLFSAAVLVSPTGCFFVGAGGGWADNWSVPAPMAEPDRYTGVEFPLLLAPMTFGLYHLFDSDESFTAPYVTCDLAMLVALVERDPKWWPVFKPLVGTYHWSESPEETGLLTGLKVGAGIPIARPGDSSVYITFEYGWLKAHDAVGDHDARFQTATAGIWVYIPLFVHTYR